MLHKRNPKVLESQQYEESLRSMNNFGIKGLSLNRKTFAPKNVNLTHETVWTSPALSAQTGIVVMGHWVPAGDLGTGPIVGARVGVASTFNNWRGKKDVNLSLVSE